MTNDTSSCLFRTYFSRIDLRVSLSETLPSRLSTQRKEPPPIPPSLGLCRPYLITRAHCWPGRDTPASHGFGIRAGRLTIRRQPRRGHRLVHSSLFRLLTKSFFFFFFFFTPEFHSSFECQPHVNVIVKVTLDPSPCGASLLAPRPNPK